MSPTITPGPMSTRYRTVTLTLVALITIIAFESLAVSTIMPEAAEALEADAGYALGFSAMFTAQLLGIVVARAWIAAAGPLRPVWIGQLVFAAGALVAGIAPAFAVFLLGRVVTGFGAGLVVVAVYVVIGAVYPEDVRPRIFAWASAAWVLPSIVGPLAAAGLAQVWSWRAVFLVVLPAVAATSAGLLRARRRLGAALADHAEPTPPALGRTVRLGVAVALGAGAFQLAGTRLVPLSPAPVLVAVLALLVLAVAVPRLLPPGTTTMRRGLPSVILARGLFGAAFGGAIAFVPLMLVTDRGLSSREAGVILALASIGWAGGSWVQGRPSLLGRSGSLLVAGAACVTAGIGVLAATSGLGWPVAFTILGTGVLGLGMGLGMTSAGVLTLALAPPRDHPEASSAMTLSETLGNAVGVTVTGTVYAALASGGQAHASTFALVWACSAAVALLAVPAGVRSRA